jgi:hypothetical protein
MCTRTRTEVRFAAPQTVSTFSSGVGRPREALSILPCDNDDQRTFDYFRRKAAPAVAGFYSTDFWENLLPRWSFSDPVVRSAILGIAKLHEYLESSFIVAIDDDAPRPAYRQSLEHYGRALRKYRQRQRRGDTHAAMAFVSCLLFAMFEFQLWNLRNALALVNTCRGMIQQITSLPNDLSLGKGICRPFSRLAVITQPTTSFVVNKRTPIPPTSAGIEPQLSPTAPLPDAAKERLFVILTEASSLVDEANSRTAIYSLPCDFSERHSDILARLEYWYDEMCELQKSWSHELDEASFQVLSAYYLRAKIALLVCPSQLETSFDEHLNSFEDLLGHLETAISYAASDEVVREFLATSIKPILPLLFVAFKCRNWTVRRRAILLLDTISGFDVSTAIARDVGQTSMNPARWAAQTAKAIIRIEEVNNEQSSSPDSVSDCDTDLIPEAARVRRLHVARLRTMTGNEGPLVIDLLLKPCGVGVDNCIKHVVVELDTGEVLSDHTMHNNRCDSGRRARRSVTTGSCGRSPNPFHHILYRSQDGVHM